MTTTYDKLDTINDSLNDIKTAIIAKGQTPSGNITTYATAIGQISGGSSPVIDSLNVTPTTSAQTITAPSGTDGYSPVNVSAVTAAIDNNIVAENIVNGVSILGVNGSAIELNATTESVTPTTSSQTVTPTSPYNGFSSVTVSAVTSSIDANITAGNIKKDVVILGVTGSYEGSGGGSTKFGMSIDNFIGNVTNGVLGSPSTINGITFTGVTEVGQNVLKYLFAYKDSFSGTVSFPDLITIGYGGLMCAFQNNNSITSVSFPLLTSIDTNGMYYAFYYDFGLTSVDLSSLTTVTGVEALSYAFYNCQYLASVDLSSLTTVSGDSALNYAFGSCIALTSVDLSSLTIVSAYSGMASCFSGCSNLLSVDLSSLTTVSAYSGMAYCFSSCDNLTTISFPSLTIVTGEYALSACFESCRTLTTINFPALTTTSFGNDYTSQFASMLNYAGTDVTHTIHFPSNLESTIQGLDGYPLFGGESGYVVLAFDLPATS